MSDPPPLDPAAIRCIPPGRRATLAARRGAPVGVGEAHRALDRGVHERPVRAGGARPGETVDLGAAGDEQLVLACRGGRGGRRVEVVHDRGSACLEAGIATQHEAAAAGQRLARQ